MKPKNKNPEFEKHLAVLGHGFFALLAGRSKLVNGKTWRVPESSPHKKWEWMRKEELQERIGFYQQLRWTTWISLNEIEPEHMTVDSVRRVAVVWFDIDAPRSDKTRPADEEEKMIAKFEAERLKQYLEETYNSRCFLACSGNGFHLYCPIPAVELPTAKNSWDFSARLREWMQRVKEESGVGFDTVYNINRLVQPIGFPNRKIPAQPLPTYWVDKFDLEDVEEAQEQNVALAESILAMEMENPPAKEPERDHVRNHPALKELLRRDRWFGNMYEGYWTQYGYISRSEAEQALVRELVHWGFNDSEIDAAMRRCGIGKWRTAGHSYRRNTIWKAREWESKKRRR